MSKFDIRLQFECQNRIWNVKIRRYSARIRMSQIEKRKPKSEKWNRKAKTKRKVFSPFIEKWKINLLHLALYFSIIFQSWTIFTEINCQKSSHYIFLYFSLFDYSLKSMSYNASFAAKRDPPYQRKTRGFDMQRQEKNQFQPLKFYGQFMYT